VRKIPPDWSEQNEDCPAASSIVRIQLVIGHAISIPSNARLPFDPVRNQIDFRIGPREPRRHGGNSVSQESSSLSSTGTFDFGLIRLYPGKCCWHEKFTRSV
jgi:hypothetical protein